MSALPPKTDMHELQFVPTSDFPADPIAVSQQTKMVPTSFDHLVLAKHARLLSELIRRRDGVCREILCSCGSTTYDGGKQRPRGTASVGHGGGGAWPS